MHTDDDYQPVMEGYENYPAPGEEEEEELPPAPTGVPEFNAMGLVALIHFSFFTKKKTCAKRKNNSKYQIPT